MSAATSGRGEFFYFAQAFQQQLPCAGQDLDRQLLREPLAARPLFRRQRNILRGVRHKLQTGDEMNEFGETGQDFGGVGAKIVEFPQNAQSLGHLAAQENFEKIDDPAPVGKPQHRAQGVSGDRAGQTRSMGNGLIEQRKRVAHRAFRRARDEAKSLVLDRDILLGADRSEVAGQQARIDAAKIESLAARAHGDRNLFDLGRREQEFHVIGRLFQSFQEAVESRFGKHMHFVDDIDLRARHGRLVTHAVDDFAHVVDFRYARRRPFR